MVQPAVLAAAGFLYTGNVKLNCEDILNIVYVFHSNRSNIKRVILLKTR